MADHFVRVGVMGHVGRFRSTEAVLYPRGSRVVCRTERGLEVGQVLVPADAPPAPVDGEEDASPHGNSATDAGDGTLLRRMTVEDELLWARLQRHRQEAAEACSRMLAERGMSAVLMDVEPLLDGQSLYFYFLGDITPTLESLIERLGRTYATKAQLRRFADTLTHGCGPDCGTEAGGGCGETCTSCAIAGACGTKSAGA